MDHPEGVNDFLSLIIGIMEDKEIDKLEHSLELTEALDDLPAPNTCHPAFTFAAGFVRTRDLNVVRIPGIAATNLRYSVEEDLSTDVPTSTYLARKKFWAPAPFVGDPRINDARYVWDVWMDKYDRHVAGDARLVWRY